MWGLYALVYVCVCVCREGEKARQDQTRVREARHNERRDVSHREIDFVCNAPPNDVAEAHAHVYTYTHTRAYILRSIQHSRHAHQYIRLYACTHSHPGMQQYPIMNGHILASSPGLETLKDVFCLLLIETSKDFTLRAVPRGKQFGKVKIATDVDVPNEVGINNNATINAGAGGGMFAMPGLRRAVSAEFQTAVQQTADIGGAPPLVRAMSNDLADRFEKMITWVSDA